MPRCTDQDKQSLFLLSIERPKYTDILIPKSDSKKATKPQVKELQESCLRSKSPPPTCISCHRLYIRTKINNPNKPALTFSILIFFYIKKLRSKKGQ